MVRPRYGRSVKGLGLGFRIENRQGQGHEQLEAVEDRLGAVIAERLQGRERHLFGYNSHPFGPMAVPTPSLYKYRALDPEFDTKFLRGTSAKIVRDKPQKEKREPAIQGENWREAWLIQEKPDRVKQGLRRWIDRLRSTDQYIEPNQHGDQNVLKISTEVHVFHHTDQTDRTLYWTVPHASGWELWLEPWPDDRFHCTGLCLHRPVFHLMKNGRDGIAFGRTNPELGHCYTFLDSTACTARMSVLELQHYPQHDDGIHQTEAWLYRTVCYSKTNDRARIQNGRTNSSPVHRNSILYCTARTARTTS